jgi:hypothetical protein
VTDVYTISHPVRDNESVAAGTLLCVLLRLDYSRKTGVVHLFCLDNNAYVFISPRQLGKKREIQVVPFDRHALRRPAKRTEKRNHEVSHGFVLGRLTRPLIPLGDSDEFTNFTDLLEALLCIQAKGPHTRGRSEQHPT